MDNIDIMDTIDKGFKKVTKLYEHLNYFDQYGGSVIAFIIISIILILIISYCYVMINVQPIINNWPNERCKTYIIPFAGYINAPPDMSANDYTFQNFNHCLQNTMSGVASTALTPITFVTKFISSVIDTLQTAINSIRAMVNNVRNELIDVIKEIMGRMMNMMIPLQQMIISFKDLVGKIEGTMTAGLFTLLGSYYTLQSLMGAIAQFIIIILIALAAMIVGFWLFPFTYGLAIANTVIFIAISIPMSIVLAFMIDVLGVQPSLEIHEVPGAPSSCFDKNTLIKMNDGSEKKIIDISVGDILFNHHKVNAKMKLSSEKCVMYSLNGVIVSGTHSALYKGKWVSISKHPESKKLFLYNEPYLYCLNTSSKKIIINGIEFLDWDELYDESFDFVIHECKKYSELMSAVSAKSNNVIHQILDGGFTHETSILLKNGNSKTIKDINVGDVLNNNETVYGIVEIDGSDLSAQYIFNLGKLFVFGGPNLNICDPTFNYISTLNLDQNKKIEISKQNKLYHLLTDKKTFEINKIKFHDYNASIDLFLEKINKNLLSMNYV